jgi:uncharacterized protein (TIGR02147 family)
MKASSMENIFTYSDYRRFIKDAIEDKRKKNPQFSYRCAAIRMGISSGSLARVLNGTRHPGSDLMRKLTLYLGLKKREAEYFSLLAGFESIKDEGKRRACYQKMLKMRAERNKPVPKEQYRFFEQWYHVALFELLRTGKYSGDNAAFGSMLIPSVSESKTRKAIELLKRLEYIQESKDGTVCAAHPFLTTGETWESVAIHAFQVAMSNLGAQALDTIPKEERDFSTLTMALSKEAFARARDVVKKARMEISAIERECTAPDRVYQINFQSFPLSIDPKKERHHGD